MARKILITGGAGFLGTNLARALVARHNEVIIADNLSRDGARKNLESLIVDFPKLKVISAEMSDISYVILEQKPDLVYHFAAQVAVTHSILSPVSDFRINGEGTFLVARAVNSLGIPVIYSSTNKVYGDNVNEVPIKEYKKRYDFDGKFSKKGINESFSIDAKHHTPYGCSKLVGELYVREYNGVVNRCSCMYGTHQHGIVDQGWLSHFVIQKLKKKPLTIFGDGKQVRDAVHASDVVELLIKQGEYLHDPKKPNIRGEVFNVGGGYKNTISLLELCEKLEIKPKFDKWRPSDQKVFYCDISKVKKVFKWEPKVSIDEGLASLVEWTKQSLK
jgi:CDP-paratose 2-epimerase